MISCGMSLLSTFSSLMLISPSPSQRYLCRYTVKKGQSLRQLLNAGRQEDAFHRSPKRGKLRRSRGGKVRFSFPRLSDTSVLCSNRIHSPWSLGQKVLSRHSVARVLSSRVVFFLLQRHYQGLISPHFRSLSNIFRCQLID